MMKPLFFSRFQFVFRCAAFLLLAPLTFSQTLKKIAAFDLPGPMGKRFDYLTIDYDDHYLLAAHLAAGLLYVIDLRTNQVVKAIPDTPEMPGTTRSASST